MINIIKNLFKHTTYIVEYKNFQGEWTLRGEYNTYHEASKRFQNHYHHCPYLLCRIRSEK